MNRLLRRGPFRTLLIGQGVSALGDWMGTFAFIALVYQQSRLAHGGRRHPRAAAAAGRARWPARGTRRFEVGPP